MNISEKITVSPTDHTTVSMNNDGVVNGVDLAVGRMAIVDLAVVRL